jgi:hypothetical protein
MNRSDLEMAEHWPHEHEVMKRARNAVASVLQLDRVSKARVTKSSKPQKFVMLLAGSLGKAPPGCPTEEQLAWMTKVGPILDAFRALGCCNARDKVYASIPLVISLEDSGLVPDYDLSLEELYVQIVDAFIKFEKSLAILASRSGRDPNMPSWVPDWRHLKENYQLCARLDTHGRCIYRASGSRHVEATISIDRTFTRSSPTSEPAGSSPNPMLLSSEEIFRGGRSVLKVRGLVLDRIAKCGPLSNNRKPFIKRDWEELLVDLPERYDPTGEATLNAYRRTTMGDTISSRAFYPDSADATLMQRIGGVIEVIERDVYNWWTQAHKNAQSYSVLSMLEDLGPQTTGLAWTRGILDESFFAPPVHETPKDTGTSDYQAAIEENSIRSITGGLFDQTTINRVLCITEKGYIGLVPYRSRVGDTVVVLFGAHTPFVVREKIDDYLSETGERTWELIGEAYVHGFMDGEAVADIEQGDTTVQTVAFALV